MFSRNDARAQRLSQRDQDLYFGTSAAGPVWTVAGPWSWAEFRGVASVVGSAPAAVRRIVNSASDVVATLRETNGMHFLEKDRNCAPGCRISFSQFNKLKAKI